MEIDPTKRFSDRVENYFLYRPRYPDAVLDCLVEACGLTSTAVVADIGSGTGFLSELFLREGFSVVGVEPNKAMRQAAETYLKSYEGFTSVNGTAEASTLEDASVDCVVAGQAFHWFDVPKAKAEFKRILKPDSYAALIWNERKFEDVPFMIAYEEFLETYGISYGKVKQTGSYPEIASFFNTELQVRTFDNVQTFGFQGLKGRFLSSSYAPLPDHPLHQPMIGALRSLFDTQQQNGRVQFEYNTRIYFGQLG